MGEPIIPSEVSIRAARAIAEELPFRLSEHGIAHFAAIIEHTTGLSELLAALTDLMECHAEGGFVEPNGEVLDAAHAAITKAKGDAL